MTEKERMQKGLVYLPTDGQILEEQADCLELLYDYNRTRPHEKELRQQLMKKMFAEVGEGCYFEPPLHSNFGGRHVHLGKNVYGNFGVTFVDDADIYVGDCVMFAPNVVVATAGHPILPSLRRKAMQFNKPVHIGSNVWIGANAVVLPGVTIGDNTVIGAGSVVTKDIPANVIAVGNPCRVLRPIGERDKVYFYKDEKYDFEIKEEEEDL
ncbi:MAG TPA: sugar O-acetyltransferase [Candidatus Borkfalkia excrementavium]|uniref:Acetyltransferase n=1 Tax=Candidatus Borkfalkia excrementavium TaxID=2838505 RepID=A0A9D1Z8E0_9FIRM|nr:sugar O-acetyltransferase [Candidatus Borkfalkia excrementavium]